MRSVNMLVVHCSATAPDIDVGANAIRRWHVDGNGWSDIGYHYVIRRNGSLEAGRPLARPGAHVRGHNKRSVAVCLVGGVDKYGVAEANFSIQQYSTLRTLILALRTMFDVQTIVGHRELDNSKDCPSFDVRKWLLSNGL